MAVFHRGDGGRGLVAVAIIFVTVLGGVNLGGLLFGVSHGGDTRAGAGEPPYSPLSPATGPPPYSVTFNESGLPLGTEWWVNLSDGETFSSPTGNVTFSEPNSTYTFAVGGVPGYAANVSGGQFTVDGSAVVVFESFAPTYTVTFSETGLTSGTSWSVTLDGVTVASTTAAIAFNESDGTYVFSIPGVAGDIANVSWGPVTVDGAPVTVWVAFAPPPNYTVTFAETGLPSGTSWSVALSGESGISTTPAIAFSEPNGTYVFYIPGVAGYTANVSWGPVTVAGANVTVSIAFVPPPTYPLTFTETGLPSGTSWSVALSGETETSATPTIVFVEPNGSYVFYIPGVPGYSVNVGWGPVTVNGAAQAVDVTFLPVPTYSVTFSETGLPYGANWSVTLDGILAFGTASTIVFVDPNGTYVFYIPEVAGYIANVSWGPVTVDGANVTVPITFVPPPTYPVTFTETGLPSGANWSVLLDESLNGSTGTSVTFNDSNGTYNFTIGNVSADRGFYIPTPMTGTVTVNGAGVAVVVVFAPATLYDLTFNETGLPDGAAWSVEVIFLDWTESLSNTSTTSSIGLRVPNGSYEFEIGSSTYWPIPGAGGILVWGAALNLSVTFIPILHNAVTFRETGLPAGATWSVTGGSPPLLKSDTVGTGGPPTIAFDAPRGMFTYAISAPSDFGVAQVVGPRTTNFTSVDLTSRTTLTVKFGLLETLYFNESVTPAWPGLPAGTNWSVTLTPSAHGGLPGMTASTNATSINFTVAKGTAYKFLVSKPSSYRPAGGKGAVTMPARTLTKLVRFRLFTSTVTFLEHGLPHGLSWSVNVTGPINETVYGTTSALKFFLTNGTYTFTVPSVGNDTPTPAAGPLAVAAPHGQSVHVTFVQPDSSSESDSATGPASGPIGATAPVGSVTGREVR